MAPCGSHRVCAIGPILLPILMPILLPTMPILMPILLQGSSGLDGANTISDLTGSIPDIVSDLLGYSVVPQRLNENQLLTGGMFNTTNVIKTGNGVNGVPAFIPVDIKTNGDSTQVCCVIGRALSRGRSACKSALPCSPA